MKKIYYLIAVLLFGLIGHSQTVHPISDPTELSGLILGAGDEVILRNGEYDSDERIVFLGTGTAEQPIVFRPESPGGVVFTGGLKMSIGGEYLTVDGFYWNGGYGASSFIEFRDGTRSFAQNCTIQNCAINGLTVSPDDLEEGTSVKHNWIKLYGNYNTVTNCTFMNKTNAGALLLVELQYNASPDEEATPRIDTRCEEVGHVITNNYFYNYEKIDTSLTNAGDSETIRIGTSDYQNVNSASVVSNNYFVQADGENEIITNKSANNTYTNNTFRRCRGSLVLRHGPGATVDRNIFIGENIDGTGGIRIVDSDHTITNNYIQDCITVLSQAKWNNGITFMGGGDNSVDDCNATSTSNGYQESENITVANNSIINTNAPLFYNADKGSNNNTGSFSNNLIYFEESANNISEIISGDADDAYDDIGASLDYVGNVFAGAELGVTSPEAVDGFSETALTANANGEIYTINGADGKGADLGGLVPFTDSDVGISVGACFLDFEANYISNPVCTIEEVESLSVSSLPEFTSDGGTETVDLRTNVSWTAVSNDNWISISPESGTNDDEISVSVEENTSFEVRNGSVTFNQTDGDLSRTLFINQQGLDIRSTFILINDGSANDNVSAEFAFDEEIDSDNGKNNPKENALDKNFNTNWSGNGANVEGFEDDVIIFNLGGTYDLALVDFASTVGKTYEFQIWVSTTGIEKEDFVNAFPDQGNLESETTSLEEFTTFILPEVIEGATFVKLFCYGQPSTTGSAFTSITEIEFYGTGETLSTDEFTSPEFLGVEMFPNPVIDQLSITSSSVQFDSFAIYTLLGDKVDEGAYNNNLDLSNLAVGLYFVELRSGDTRTVKRIIKN